MSLAPNLVEAFVGDAIEVDLDVTDLTTGELVTMTGWNLRLVVARDMDLAALVTKTTAGGHVNLKDAGKKAYASLTTADTTALGVGRFVLVWDRTDATAELLLKWAWFYLSSRPSV